MEKSEAKMMIRTAYQKVRGSLKIKAFLLNSALISFVVLWSVASYIQWYAGSRSVTYSIQGEKSVDTLEIVQGDVLTQEIYINQYIDNFQILLNNGGGDRALTNFGMLHITLQQGNVVKSFVLDIRGVPDWTYQNFQGSLEEFQDGPAILKIEALNTKLGSSLFVPYAEQDIYELPAASYNGRALSGPLFLRYETESPALKDGMFYVMGGLLILAVIGAGVILTWCPKRGLVFGITVLLVFLTICFKYPTYTIRGEIWAEQGTIYLPSARDTSFFKNLVVLEWGLYLNVLGRLISWIAVHCFSLEAASFVVDILSLLLLAMMGSAWASGALKKYITPLESVLMSVLLTTCFVNAETVATPLITAYWGIVPLLILLAVIVFQIELSNKLYWVFGITTLICTLSRMYYVIYIPILIVVAIILHKQLRYRDWAFFSLEILAAIVQGIGSLILRRIEGYELLGSDSFGAITFWNPLKLVGRTLYYQIQTLLSMLRLQPTEGFAAIECNMLVLIALAIGTAFLLIRFVKDRNLQAVTYAVILILTACGPTAMQLISNGYPIIEGWDTTINIVHDRFWMFSYLGWLGIVILVFLWFRSSGIYQRERGCRIVGTVAMAICLLCVCSVQTENAAQFYDQREDSGDWENYSQMISHETYAIQGYPYDWMLMSPDCQVMRGFIEKDSQLNVEVDTKLAASVYVYKDKAKNQLRLRSYYISVYDENGELAAHVPQISNQSEYYAGFDLNLPINGISRLEFTYEDGEPAFINGNYQICYRRRALV